MSPKRITIKGLVGAEDGTDRLIPVEFDITDQALIAKIERGYIHDFSLCAEDGSAINLTESMKGKDKR